MRSAGVDREQLENAELGRRAPAFYVSARFVQPALLFVSAVIVARALGPDGRAQYALALALATISWGLVHLSLDSAAGRLLARDEASVMAVARALTTATLAGALVGGAFAAAVGLVTADLLLAGADRPTILFAAATVPSLLAIQMAEALLLRLGRIVSCGVAAVAGALAGLVAVVALAAADAVTPASVTAASLLGNTVNAVVLVQRTAAVVGTRALVPSSDRRVMASGLRIGLVLHPSTLGLQLAPRLQLLVVGLMASTVDTGLFSLASTLAVIVFSAAWTLSEVALRRQTFAAADEGARYTARFAGRMLRFSAPAALVACLGAYPFVVVVYGREWAGSVASLVVLIVAMLAFTYENPVRAFLVRVASPSVITKLALGSLVVNLGLTVCLVQLLGIVGAAIASVLAYWSYTLLIGRAFENATGHPAPILAVLSARRRHGAVR